jgi:hypothetical protein
MKKIIVLIFIFFLVFTLSSCGDKTTPVANYNENPPTQIHSPAPGGENTAPTETDTQNTTPDNQTVIPDEGTPTTASDSFGDGEPPTETDSPTPTPDVGNSTSTGTGTQNTVPDNQTNIPGQGTPTTVNDPIGSILGVGYNISDTEYHNGYIEWGWEYFWRLIDIYELVDIDDFIGEFTDWPILTQTGDIFVLNGFWWRPDATLLVIDLGDYDGNNRNYGIIAIITDELTPAIKRIHINDLPCTTCVRLTRCICQSLFGMAFFSWEQYGMTLVHASNHFYFHTHLTANNPERIQNMINIMEDAYVYYAELFGFDWPGKLPVYYWYRPHVQDLYAGTAWESGEWYGSASEIGMLFNDYMEGSYICPYNKIPMLHHEIIHVFQWNLLNRNWNCNDSMLAWVIEGTADYLQHGRSNWATTNHWALLISEMIKNDPIPTLNCLEDDSIGWWAYVWGASIIMFIDHTWGFDYVIEKNRTNGDYQGIFGITRAEFESQWHQWLHNHFN